MRSLLFFTAALTSLALPVLAHADAIISGSTFDVYLGGAKTSTSALDESADFTVTQGAAPTAFSFGNATGTISDTQTSLGDGAYQIVVDIQSTNGGDLFPNANYYAGYAGVGIYNPIDLTGVYDLTSDVVSFATPSGVYVSGSADASDTNPFEGAVPATHLVVGAYPVDGRDTTNITFTLDVAPAPTPEPGALLLTGTGLIGMATAVRRRLSA